MTSRMLDVLGGAGRRAVLNEVKRYGLFADGRVATVSLGRPDREVALALEDVRKGRTHGPFDSVDALMRSLRQESKKRKRAKKAP